MSLIPVLNAVNIYQIDLLSINVGDEEATDKISDVIRSKNHDIRVKITEIILYWNTDSLFFHQTLLVGYTSASMMSNPFPFVKGYILDAKRSQMLVKFYVKKKYCSLVSTSNCEAVRQFDPIKACLDYFCMGYLTVKTYDPEQVQKMFEEAQKN